jgi:hypothetical protein
MLTQIDLQKITDHILTMVSLLMAFNMELRFQENEDQKMITGAEISTVNTVTNSTFHTPLFTLTLNKSIAEVQMVKLCHFLQVDEEEADQRKIQIKGQILELKNFLKLLKEKAVL